MTDDIISSLKGTGQDDWQFGDKRLVDDGTVITLREIDEESGVVGDRASLSIAGLLMDGEPANDEMLVSYGSIFGQHSVITKVIPDVFIPEVVEDILPVGTLAGIVQGRLSVSSTDPIGDGTTTGDLHYLPFNGSKIALYDVAGGNIWRLYEIDSMAVSISSLTTSHPYDVYAYINAGAAALEIDEINPWADSVTPTAMDDQDGYKVKAGDPTRRYLGSFRMISDGEVTDDVGKRNLWNEFNQVPRVLYKDASVLGVDNWGSGGGTWRGWNGTTDVQVTILARTPTRPIDLSASIAAGRTDSSTGGGAISIFRDALVGITNVLQGATFLQAGNVISQLTAKIIEIPPVGYHIYLPVERDNGGACNFYGTDGATRTAGLIGTTWA